jgi:hypothetical protein
MVKLSRTRSGYRVFSAPGCRVPIAVHRFAAFQIHGETALGADCVRHLNDQKDDNRHSNLAPGTRSENYLDIPPERRSLMGRKRNRSRRNFSELQISEIRSLLDSGVSVQRLSILLDCSLGAISNIQNGITYLDVVGT